MTTTTTKGRSVLLNGATGFIGSHLARHLADAGNEVHVIVRPESDLGPLRDLKGKIQFHLFAGKTEMLRRIVDTARPACIFHLATHFIAEHRTSDISSLIQSNVEFGVQVLEAMKESGISSLVNAGTSWQNFENCRSRPATLYAATKEAFEVFARYYADAYGMRIMNLRLSDSYGPSDKRRKLFWHLREAALSGTQLQMSEGNQFIDLLYIDDIVRAFSAAGERVLANHDGTIETFRLSSSERITLRQIVSRYAQVAGIQLDVAWGARPYRAREIFQPWTDDPILPGWVPIVTLEEGIRRLTYSPKAGS